MGGEGGRGCGEGGGGMWVNGGVNRLVLSKWIWGGAGCVGMVYFG